MKINRKDIELIEAYIKNELEQAERKKIEQRLENDTDFQAAYEDHLTLMEEIELGFLRNEMKEVHMAMQGRSTTSEPKITRLYSWLSAAAAILLLVSFWWFMTGNKDYEDIYQAHYEVDPGLPTVMSGVDTRQLFMDGMVDYKLGDYQKADEKWANLSSNVIDNDTLMYYRAMAAINLGWEDQAKSRLQKIAEMESDFSSNSLWYLALLAIKGENMDDAKKYLSKTKHPQKSELLKAIEEMK